MMLKKWDQSKFQPIAYAYVRRCTYLTLTRSSSFHFFPPHQINNLRNGRFQMENWKTCQKLGVKSCHDKTNFELVGRVQNPMTSWPRWREPLRLMATIRSLPLKLGGCRCLHLNIKRVSNELLALLPSLSMLQWVWSVVLLLFFCGKVQKTSWYPWFIGSKVEGRTFLSLPP